MSTLAILTVGTGTAGRHSNLAQGLINTLQLLQPCAFWLVPSSSPDSTAVADLIAEGVEDGLKGAFREWDASRGLTYRCIEDPDDLEQCRQTVREVIRQVRGQLQEGDRLVLNPVSGTKQMSAGATLAALDEEIGQIIFTVGERADGVVKTGTERLASFDAGRYFEERDLATAEALFQAGAFWPASKVLEKGRSPAVKSARAKALCMQEWHRLNHAEAAKQAGKFSPDLAARLQRLAVAEPLSLEVLLDILGGADELLRWGDYDEALARYYRGAELAAKFILAAALGIRPTGGGADGYALSDLEAKLPEGDALRQELRQRGRSQGLFLGLDLAWRILAALGHAAGKAFAADQRLRDQLDRRNLGLYGHGVRFATREEVEALRSRLRRVLEAGYPAASVWSGAGRVQSLRER